MACGELGHHKLNEIIEAGMVYFWCRTVNGSEFKSSHMMYKFLRALYDQNIYYSPWLSTIKNILDKTGMSFVWNMPNSVNHFCPNNPIIPHPWFIKAIKLRLSDMYKQEWLAEVNRNFLCKVYRIIKTSLEFEKYLHILDFRNHSYVCKYRCINTDIPVVSGRYHNIVFDDRICNLCKSDNYLGDEFHYILECAAFKNERNLFLKPYFRTRPSSIKMRDLFQSKSKSVINNLSMFCSKIMKAFP